MSSDQLQSGLPDVSPDTSNAKPTNSDAPDGDDVTRHIQKTKIAVLNDRAFDTIKIACAAIGAWILGASCVDIHHSAIRVEVGDVRRELNEANRDREALILHNRILEGKLADWEAKKKIQREQPAKEKLQKNDNGIVHPVFEDDRQKKVIEKKR